MLLVLVLKFLFTFLKIHFHSNCCLWCWVIIYRMVFGRPFVKRFALCYRSVVCPVCDVRALWPNGGTDQDETWYAGRPRPWPHCVRWGPSSPSPKAGCINMSLGTDVGLSPGHFVLDGNPLPPARKGAEPPQYFWPMFIVAKRLDASRCHLVCR